MLNDCNLSDTIKSMTREQLLDLQSQINELLAVSAAGDESTPKKKAKKPRADSPPYIEIKKINGHRYAYERWWEGGKLKGKFLHKVND